MASPLDPDSDGDELVDGQEVTIGTSPAKKDSDGDGLPDGWEVQHCLDPLSINGEDGDAGDPDGDGVDNLNEYNMRTNPSAADSDNDGLSDGEEAVCVSFATPLPWLEFTTIANLTGAIADSYGCITIDLPSPVAIQQEIVTNITIDVDGVVFVNKSGYVNPEWTGRPYDFDDEVADPNCLTVAPYWDSFFLSDEVAPSSVKLGTATVGVDGYYVLECKHLYNAINSYETNAISFQMAFPTGHVDRIYVRYADVVGDEMDGRYALIGCQSFDARETVTYCSFEQGKVNDGMGLCFVVGCGSDPTKTDTDGDGIADNVEVDTYGSDPRSADTDGDGFSDSDEIALGTSIRNPDSDGDGLLDGWEVANAFNPLSQPGQGDADGDADEDGLANIDEQLQGSNPRNADTDDDGLPDQMEIVRGTNISLGDTDHDGLLDGLEVSFGTNPLQPDTDSDGMNDGWEYQHRAAGFDPRVDNARDRNPDNDIDADPDGDKLTNGQECEWGTNPVNADTDGDGIKDGAEVGQNSDPADANDEGKPKTRIPITFRFGDPSDSHSEKYRLEVTPVSGHGEAPASFSWLNENYGESETKRAMLKPGWKYEVRLYHAGTDPDYDGSPRPDYDYELSCDRSTAIESVIVVDDDGLFDGYRFPKRTVKEYFGDELRALREQVTPLEIVWWWFVRVCMIAALIYRIKKAQEGESSTPVMLLSVNLAIAFLVPLVRLICFPKLFFGKMNYRVQSFIMLFTFAGSFLGQGVGLQHSMDDYDKLLHLVSGGVVVFVGWALIESTRRASEIPRGLKTVASFGFSCVVMVVWEIFEFFSDFYMEGSINQNWHWEPGENMFFYRLFGKGVGQTGMLVVLDTDIDIFLAFVGCIVCSLLLYGGLVLRDRSRGKALPDGEKKKEARGA